MKIGIHKSYIYKKEIKDMKYNTDKNKLVMLPIEVKDRLDNVITSLVKERLNNGDKKLKVSYADAIKHLLEKNDM